MIGNLDLTEYDLMKTMRQIAAWKKKHNVYSPRLDVYNRFWYSIESEGVSDWDDFEEHELGFSQDELTACCAIPMITYLTGAMKGALKTVEAWEMILAEYIRTKKYAYLLCSTTSKPEYKEINAALPLVGFKLQKTVKSKHAGKYPVYFWAYEKNGR